MQRRKSSQSQAESPHFLGLSVWSLASESSPGESYTTRHLSTDCNATRPKLPKDQCAKYRVGWECIWCRSLCFDVGTSFEAGLITIGTSDSLCSVKIKFKILNKFVA